MSKSVQKMTNFWTLFLDTVIYMYHSILFDKSGKYIKSGQYELGSKASHGCVRLSEKDSAWLYTHIPVNTTVWIR